MTPYNRSYSQFSQLISCFCGKDFLLDHYVVSYLAYCVFGPRTRVYESFHNVYLYVYESHIIAFIVKTVFS